MADPKEDPPRDPKQEAFVQMGRALGGAHGSSYRGLTASLTFGASVALFTLGGYWLDGKLDTLPLFLLIGLACGLVGGFIHMVETVSPGTLFKTNKPRP